MERLDRKIIQVERLESEINNIANRLLIRLRETDSASVEIKRSALEELYIKKKGGGISNINLDERPFQLEILALINRNLAEGKPTRIIMEKDRRCGSSTFFAILAYHLVRDYGLSATIIGHNALSTNNLYNIILTAYKKDAKIHDNPTLEHELKNSKKLTFPNGGVILVATAGTPDAATGTTNQILICTEEALWPGDPGAQMATLLKTVADDEPFTFVIVESTPREQGNDYHTRVVEAIDGISGTTFYFVSWLKDPQCTKAFENYDKKKRFVESLSREELILMKPENEEGFGATLEQLYWRRWTILNKTQGKTLNEKLQNFRMDYPTYPEEGFLKQGSAVFPIHALKRMRQYARPPIFKGEINWELGSGVFSVVEDFKDDNKGLDKFEGGGFWVWEWAQKNESYAIGADVAKGGQEENANFSAFWVRKVSTGKCVARWKGKIHPSDFGDLLTCVGLIYDMAYIAVEANNHGLTTLDKLWSQYPQEKLYRQFDVEVMAAEPRDYLGWTMTGKNKPRLMDMLSVAISKGFFECHDIETIDELCSIVHRDGKIPTTGKDLTIAAAISEEARRHAPVVVKETIVITYDEAYQNWFRERDEEAEMQAISAYSMGGTDIGTYML